MSAATMRAEGAPEATPPEAPASTVVGYIDAIVDGRVFGWAWDPREPARAIAIRLVDEAGNAIEGLADRHRDDLAANGVGNGDHAFELAIGEGASPDGVKVLAICPTTNAAIVLVKPPPAAVASPEGANVVVDEQARAAMTSLWRNLRAVHQEVEDLKAKAGASSDAASSEETIASRLDAAEAAIFRIDQSLSARFGTKTESAAGPDMVARVLAGFAAFAALAALVAAIAR